VIYLDTSVALAQLLALHLASAEFLRSQGEQLRVASYDERFVAVAHALDFEAVQAAVASGTPFMARRAAPSAAFRPANIVGTIAGDDTIFVAAKDATAQRRLVRELKKVTAAGVG
jgi:arginine repressor